ncbi:TPA: hypothetical protein OXS70_002156 [Acinetobacter baumannii]|nr:hypothetical protein [Acinetobacter baumannii]EKX9959444.1 hypothetical protein [Acinetobacter baumannii]EKY0928461.1 hypothetical protein [Acinetobacter baumannii]EKY1173506.1 hypothetical protein [Acinetobacter baumannii]HCW3947884.1 hypothetical protein [Acinetobacter baumannii]
MADYVDVYLYVHPDHEAKAVELLDVPNWCVDRSSDMTLTELTLSSMRYADIDEESETLLKAGIPHVWCWDDCGDIEGGRGYCIFNKDYTVNRFVYTDVEGCHYIQCQTILGAIDKGSTPEEIKQRILDYMAKRTQPTIDAEQVRRGKVYKLKKVVTA